MKYVELTIEEAMQRCDKNTKVLKELFQMLLQFYIKMEHSPD